jgi:hypothetical protein
MSTDGIISESQIRIEYEIELGEWAELRSHAADLVADPWMLKMSGGEGSLRFVAAQSRVRYAGPLLDLASELALWLRGSFDDYRYDPVAQAPALTLSAPLGSRRYEPQLPKSATLSGIF